MPSKPYTSDLEVFVALANLLPDDSPQSRQPGSAQPIDLPAIYKRVLDAFPGPIDPRTSASLFETAQRIPKIAVGGTTFLLADRATDDAERLSQVYGLLVVLRGALGRLTVTSSIGIHPGGEYRSPKEVGRPTVSATFLVRTKEDRHIVIEDGRIRVQPSILDAFFAALDGAPLDRLRRCPKCGAFFLAQRKDKGGCSSSCCNALNVRAHRRRAKEGRYTEARKESKKRKREREERRARLQKTKAKM